jgi:hypothetical protein
MTPENLKLILDNQRVIMESLTYLILLEGKRGGAEDAMTQLRDLQTQWIATMRGVAAVTSDDDKKPKPVPGKPGTPEQEKPKEVPSPGSGAPPTIVVPPSQR